MMKKTRNYLLVTFQREVGWCNTSSGIVLPLLNLCLNSVEQGASERYSVEVHLFLMNKFGWNHVEYDVP